MAFERTIIITGGAGFIGSNYLNKFVVQYPKYRFVNVDALTYAGNLKNIHENVSGAANYVFEKGDIRELAWLEQIFAKYKPDSIIHFAAESHVDISIKNPGIFVETNIVGTHNLLMLAKKYGIKRYHQVSTDEVYGSLETMKGSFTEETPIAPNSAYSASKASADLLVRSYFKTFGLNATITRCSNNYGPHADTTKLIPLFITRLMRGEKVPLYGKGENVRDWLYVEDHIDAIDLVFHKGKAGEVYNVGGNTELSNMQIVKKLLELTGRGPDMIEYVADRPGHDFRYAIDASKIKRELGWTPKVSFEQGIQRTFEFYKAKTAKTK
jgi:dTDP-glucose 4,6-dehydratase